MHPLTKQSDGTWQTDIQMKLNESREFSIHLGMPQGPPDFTNPQHFKSKVCLINGELINHVYEDHKLTVEKKGRIKKRLYRVDGTLSESLPVDYKKKDGEELVDVYIPANYSPEKQYPIQVFLDGDMHVEEDSFGNSIGTPNILDNLIASGEMTPVIAVFTSPSPVTSDGSNQRLRDYACNPVTDQRLANLPQAVRNCGLSVETSDVTICGQSLGGFKSPLTVYSALSVVEDICFDLDADKQNSAEEKLMNALESFNTYITNNAGLIPSYSDRYHYGEIIATAFVESTVNELISKRMVKNNK